MKIILVYIYMILFTFTAIAMKTKETRNNNIELKEVVISLAEEKNRKSLEHNISEVIKNSKINSSSKNIKMAFNRQSHDSMKRDNENIIVEVPTETKNAFETIHKLELLAHNELNKKIENIEYQCKQMCENNFSVKDDMQQLVVENQRNNKFNRLLFLGCSALGIAYIVLSITGVIIGAHFIPTK